MLAVNEAMGFAPADAVTNWPKRLTAVTARAQRGSFWQCGQKWLDRFMNDTRTIGRPQRGHGCAGAPVGVQRMREVAGLAVDVHVLRVEARAALGERLARAPRAPRRAAG